MTCPRAGGCAPGLPGPVRGAPAPDLGTLAAPRHALAVDVGNHVAVAAEQRLGRAHLGAGRQLALGEPVAAVLLELRFAAVRLGPARAEGALVHLAAHAEGARLRELRCAERAGVEAIAAADAQVLVVQHHAVVGAVEAVDRAHRHAGRIRAVHAGDRHRLLGADHAVVDGDDAAAVHAPGHLVLVLAGGDAAVALDAALGITQEFHSRHGCVSSSLCRRHLAERCLGFLHHASRCRSRRSSPY